jgi:4-diphosphocytidyl-2-C-methyl-D-erythritol kinase
MTTVMPAPAKLTLSLRITGVRADGLHLLDAFVVTLDWGDDLTFSTGDGLTIDGPAATGVPTDDRNLVRGALAAVGRRAAVHVHKRIPAGAGLGGGSADAAAVLRWAGCHDLEVAASLGADVPFCLVGGRARVRGIGEHVTPLAHVAETVTLCLPPLAVSTAAVYARWDGLGGPVGDGPNDLEAAALAVEPQLMEWRERFGAATGARPVLAGSGSTWFVPGDLGAVAPRLAPAMVVVATTTPAERNGSG